MAKRLKRYTFECRRVTTETVELTVFAEDADEAMARAHERLNKDDGELDIDVNFGEWELD